MEPSKVLEQLRDIRKRPFNWEELIKVLDDVEQELEELSKYKNPEQELGCPLEVREKAFKNGFYDVDGNSYFCEHYVPYLKQMHTTGIMAHTEKHFNLADYKKTWWLREDKSE